MILDVRCRQKRDHLPPQVMHKDALSVRHIATVLYQTPGHSCEHRSDHSSQPAACRCVPRPVESPSMSAHRDPSSRSFCQLSCQEHKELTALRDPTGQGSCLQRALSNCLRRSCCEYPSDQSHLASRRACHPSCSSTTLASQSARRHVRHLYMVTPTQNRSSHEFPGAASPSLLFVPTPTCPWLDRSKAP